MERELDTTKFFIGQLAIVLALSVPILIWAWRNHQEAKLIRTIGNAFKKARMELIQPRYKRN